MKKDYLQSLRRFLPFVFLTFCAVMGYAQSSLYNTSSLQNSANISGGGGQSLQNNGTTPQNNGTTPQNNGTTPQNNGTTPQNQQPLTAAADFVVNTKLAMASKEYPVTAGDIYSLSFVVKNEVMTFSIPVDSSYQVKIANLAVIGAYGKTFLELKKQVEEVVNKNYPLSGVQFAIFQPSVFNVVVAGEVLLAAEKKAWGLSRLSSVVADSLTSYSSTRNVLVVSEDGTERTYDLFKAERDGDFRQDPYVRPGDRVILKKSVCKATVFGAVKRPGRYDLLEGEGIQELVELYGGGLAESADISRIEIYRTDGEYNSSGRKIYLSSLKENYPLANSDSVLVSSYKNSRPAVFIEGSVESKQTDITLEASNRVIVPFDQGENYSFLIRRNKHLFTTSSDLENSYIKRKGAVIMMDLQKILYNADYYSPQTAEADDVLVVPFKQSFVSVAGAVNVPGRYPYIPDRDWRYYVGLAGGFNKSMNSGEKITIIDMNGKKHGKSEPIVPETTITASTNSFMYYIRDMLPLISTMMGTISTTLSVMAVLGVFNR